MRGKGHQIDFQLRQINRHLARRLRRIGMENHALFAANLAHGRNILNHANFVIHQHDRGQNGIGSDGCSKLVQIHQPIGFYFEIGSLKTLALELTHRVQYRLMLGLDSNNVFALVLIKMGSALDGQVVRLGGS